MSTSAFHEDPIGRFRRSMPKRVRRILLVASAYDSFILEQDGRTGEGLIARPD